MKRTETGFQRPLKNRFAWMVISIWTICTASCTETADSAGGVRSISNAMAAEEFVEGEDAASIPSELLSLQPADDETAETVRINWVHDDAKSMKKKVDAMVLTIRNAMDKELSAHVTVRFSGLALESATMDLGTLELIAKGESTLSIPTDALPLQTTRGVCKAVAQLEVSDESGFITAAGSEGLYYRHLPNYKGVHVFGEKIFEKEEKGKFFDISAEEEAFGIEAAAEASLGRKLNAKGVFEDVRASTHALWAVGDSSPIIVTRMSSGTAPEDPEQELKEMNDAE